MTRRSLLGIMLAPCLHAATAPDPEQLRERFQQLTARATGAISALRSLERRVRRAGHSLRADLIAERVRLESAMDDAEAGLQKLQWEAAEKAISKGELSASRIEAFLKGK